MVIERRVKLVERFRNVFSHIVCILNAVYWAKRTVEQLEWSMSPGIYIGRRWWVYYMAYTKQPPNRHTFQILETTWKFSGRNSLKGRENCLLRLLICTCRLQSKLLQLKLLELLELLKRTFWNEVWLYQSDKRPNKQNRNWICQINSKLGQIIIKTEIGFQIGT